MKNPGFAGAVAGAALVALILMAAGVDYDPARAGPGITIAFVIGTMGGGFCGLALRRGLRGASAGFWQTTVGRWLIGRIAGTAVYLALVALLWEPAIYALAYTLAGIIRIGGWPIVAVIAPVLPWMIWALALSGAWFLRTRAKVFVGKGSAPLRRFYRSLRMGQGGSSSFAGICEEWANRWRPGMIFLGHSLFDRHWRVGIKDDRMLCTLAGTGGGKGDSAILPNLLAYPGSAFVIDVKGQNAAVSAGPRRKAGQTVHIIDPLNVLGEGTARLDPLSDLDPEALDYVERLKSIVGAIVISTGERNRFFEEGAKIVIAGAIDLLKRRRTGEFVQPSQEEEFTDGQ
jgi:type IV secretory pathway TraG/TraD family ATPase VirD4